MAVRLAAFVVGTAATASAASIDCFTEHQFFPPAKNICERAFHDFPVVSNVAACGAACLADEDCVMFAWELKKSKGPQCRVSSTCKVPTAAVAGYDAPGTSVRHATRARVTRRRGAPVDSTGRI